MKVSILLFTVLSAVIIVISCNPVHKTKTPEKNTDQHQPQHLLTSLDSLQFKGTIEGKAVGFYVLKNINGLEAVFTNYGQRLLSLSVPDKKGNFDDIVLGFSDLDQYTKPEGKYFGAIIGRYANRIAKGTFAIGDSIYQLETNNGSNHLHGGVDGFNRVVWDANQVSDQEIEFSRISSNGEEGYPGNLSVKVQYKLTNQNELKIRYTATTDQSTVVNLTHHSFFNLAGADSGTIYKHLLLINADQYIPIDHNSIPYGRLEKVADTPFDFRQPKPMGEDLFEEHQQLVNGSGYDHTFVINNVPKSSEGLSLAAIVAEPKSGRMMEVYTDEPGIQFYSGNFLSEKLIGKERRPYVHRGGFSLETQHFPDSPNQKNFPSTLLRPGETYISLCTYKFLVQN
ncbi:galactose mutarotase [Aquimarina sp. ERC-38]|uniref:aldose epimerase family protein n=1 Tax=Aquimarina sp. ERC-38 TaxID=2949996 RepID=UPI0022451C9B|nr:aldose epimerase family protein [Aquimarina sp. ERC-38]UZO82624.1 galactose mutarotase [Aquimarina sp. ERC-38]